MLGNGINFNFNTGNDASYSGQLQQLLTNLSANQTFTSAGQIGTTNTVGGYAIASASWLETQRQSASSESTYQSTLLSSSTTALSNTTGVNLDDEMSKMLDLENTYSATAKLLTTSQQHVRRSYRRHQPDPNRMTSYISSYSISSALRQSVLTAQSNLAIAEQEVSTGTYADVGLQLGGSTNQDFSLRSEQSLMQTHLGYEQFRVDATLVDSEHSWWIAVDGAELPQFVDFGAGQERRRRRLANLGAKRAAIADFRAQYFGQRPIYICRHQYRRRSR